MGIFDSSTSRYSLQRWVGYVGGAAAILVASLNLFSILDDRWLAFVPGLLSPAVLSIYIFGLLFFCTTLADSHILRIIQVVVFLSAGALTAIGSQPGNITSALFIVYGILLLNEYAEEEESRMLPSLLIGAAYMALFVVTTQTDTLQPVVYLVSVTIFTGAVVVLYALISYRQSLMRKRQLKRLEQAVSDRTKDLRAAVTERDHVIHELHHRVGNSLQLLASYVSLRRGEIPEAEGKTLAELELRVHAIASVHATLFSLDKQIALPLRDYCHERIADASLTFERSCTIQHEITTELEAHIDFALSFGIIIAELLTNAAKHGSAEQEKADVRIRAWDQRGELRLEVRDRGHGFRDESQHGTGSVIVDELVAQQRGTIRRYNDNGAVTSLSFPVDSVTNPES